MKPRSHPTSTMLCHRPPDNRSPKRAHKMNIEANITGKPVHAGKPLNERPPKRPVKLIRWFIIVGLGLVLIVGAFVGFETFRANMIKQFFAGNKPPPTAVNVAEAKSEVIPNLLTAVG